MSAGGAGDLGVNLLETPGLREANEPYGSAATTLEKCQFTQM